MYHFIMNPKASSGRGMKAWTKIEQILKKEQVEYETHMLGSEQETISLVQELTSKKIDNAALECKAAQASDCHLVVLGGDGTINAVLNGIIDFEHTIISCIRTGSGNDFARNIGVTKNTSKALEHLLHTPDKMVIDYGEAVYKTESGEKYRRFAISNGVGYDADICEEVGRSKLKQILNRVGLGKLVYVMIGVKQIFTRKNTGAILCFDNEEVKDIANLFFVVGMIHEREGGGVPFCPRANCTDGILDVCLVRQMPKMKLLLAVMIVYMKQHYRFQAITEHRCKTLSVKLSEPQWFHMDGEISQKISEITMTCKQGLRFYK